ncbi:hypothetical protein [Streptomyces vastus]|uniref:Tyr recombinase domain-containing protein n=1 Tax=Streptomyces vastus TaxID=285451 RepID=A0ABN3QMF5_9ACTN
MRSLAPNGIKIMLKRRGLAAGLVKLHAHRWRHTFAHEWKRELFVRQVATPFGDVLGRSDDRRQIGGRRRPELTEHRLGRIDAQDRPARLELLGHLPGEQAGPGADICWPHSATIPRSCPVPSKRSCAQRSPATEGCCA